MLEFLVTLGGISLAMSAVILLMLILQKPVKKRFSAIAGYIIWSVIIIRLCLPVSLDILPKLITFSADIREEETVIHKPATPEAEYIPEDVIPSVPSESINEPVYDEPLNETYKPSTPAIDTVPEKAPEFKLSLEQVTQALFTVWATGAIAFMTLTLIRYGINAKGLDRRITPADTEILGIYNTVCRELKIKKAPPLYMGRADMSPMVYGFIKPKVILPKIEVSTQNLVYILRHELIHYKRGDLYFKLFALLANALHWFNPLVYFACGMMSAEAELSCDEKALRNTDLIERLGYGNSMLEIVKTCKHSPKLTTGFSPKKRAVKERFENMMNITKKKKGYWIVAIILICALLCTSIIGCTTSHESSVVQGTDDITAEQQEVYENTEDIDQNLLEEQRIKEGKFHVKVDQWHTESEEWKLYYDFDAETLVLEHIDGRRFAYGEESEGVHTLSPAYKHGENTSAYSWLIGDYIVINYNVQKNKNEDLAPTYLALVDINDGSVKAVHTGNVDEILALHGLDRDYLIPFKDWYGTGMLDYSYSFYPMGNEDSPTISLYTTLTFSGMTYSLNCVTEFDKATGKLGKTVATKLYYDDPDPLEEWEKKYAVKLEDITRIENVRGADGAEVFKAFLNRDTAYLEEKADYPKGTLDAYKTLRFGDYMFATDKFASGEVKDLLLFVEITESRIEGLEPGMHRFVYNNRAHGEYISHYCAHYTGLTQCEPATMWIGLSDEPMLPDPQSYTESDFWAMMMMLRYDYSASTVDEFEERADSVFGVSVDLGDYTIDKLYGEMEKWEYKDDKLYNYTVTEYSENYVIVQFYADYGMTVPAYKIRYNFHHTEITDDGRTFDEQVFDAPSVKFDITDKEAIYS